jgi:membrane protein YqaA with SNARE-associated domain
MLGTILALMAGWHRSKAAAILIMLFSFVVSMMFVLPSMVGSRRLLGLSASESLWLTAQIAGQVILGGIAFYLIGSGARWLWDSRQRKRLIRGDDAS